MEANRMFSIILENEKGEQLDLNKNYFTEITDGLTPPNASINMAKVTGANGAQFNSSMVNSRNIVLSVYPKNPVETHRISLYRFLPIGGWVKFYYKNDKRNIYTEGYVESLVGNLFTKLQMIQVSILCPDSFFKSAGEIITDISKLVDLFEFPMCIEKSGIALSEFNEYLIGQVNNEGDMSTGLIIELNAIGTVVNPVIHDANTRESMALHITMQASDLIRINTIVGKSHVELIRAGSSMNLINVVNDEASWLQAKPGVNFYTYTVDSGLDNLIVKFRANALYSGV